MSTVPASSASFSIALALLLGVPAAYAAVAMGGAGKAGLVLVYTSFNLPLVIWMMQPFFETVPQSLEEAALVDGASTRTVLLQTILPLVASGIAATAILRFLYAWNDFFFALILTRTNARTAPVAVVNFMNYEGWEMGQDRRRRITGDGAGSDLLSGRAAISCERPDGRCGEGIDMRAPTGASLIALSWPIRPDMPQNTCLSRSGQRAKPFAIPVLRSTRVARLPQLGISGDSRKSATKSSSLEENDHDSWNRTPAIRRTDR